jgi:hypothetical protein
MKLVAVAAAALLASTVSARSSLFGSSPAVSPNDDGSLAVPGENPLQHCADPKDDILTIASVDLDPNPPKAYVRPPKHYTTPNHSIPLTRLRDSGQTLKVNARGKLNQDVEDGAKIHLTVKYGLITIIKQTADLCENVKNVDLECPLEKDKDTALTKEVDLPKEIPPGKYTVVAEVVTKDGDKVTCLTATLEFKRGGGMVEQVLGGEWKQGL